MNSQPRKFLGKFLITVLVVNCFSRPSPILTTVYAQQQAQQKQQNKIIVVNAEQPNVWTLEQAHYLLAQMRQRNLDLRAKRLEALIQVLDLVLGLLLVLLKSAFDLGVLTLPGHQWQHFRNLLLCIVDIT